ncbi:MAG: hypothetical protein HF309_10785 [Ignavibacteria bacterium]|jgi:hypothetical protein|nr:hypothetical protein [Ignavibacteria bacterium]
MKQILILLFPVIFFMSLNGCSKKDNNMPVGPGDQGTPDGIYSSEGLVSWISPYTEVAWNFSGDKLSWDLSNYKKETPESQLAFDYQSSYNYSFKTDNSFLIVNPLDVNKYLQSGPMYFHYKLDGGKLMLSPGRIYTGSSNNLTGTVWEFNISPSIYDESVKYIYNNDKTGLYIIGTLDTIRFTYSTEGNTISHEYSFHGRKVSFKGTYEIKDNKFYFYDRQGEGKSEFEYENLGTLTLYKSPSTGGTKDFFPLLKGNRWDFYYYFAPERSYGTAYTSGNLSWEIVSASGPDENKTARYGVRETFEGYKIQSSGDSVSVGPDTAYFNITEDAFHRLTINSQLTALGEVRIKRFYNDNVPGSVKINAFNYTSHEITLVRNSGPSEWKIGMSSNSDISGVLRTINRLLIVE